MFADTTSLESVDEAYRKGSLDKAKDGIQARCRDEDLEQIQICAYFLRIFNAYGRLASLQSRFGLFLLVSLV